MVNEADYSCCAGIALAVVFVLLFILAAPRGQAVPQNSGKGKQKPRIPPGGMPYPMWEREQGKRRLERDLEEAADDLGLKGEARKQFIRDWMTYQDDRTGGWIG
jgi:hypothetical protein